MTGERDLPTVFWDYELNRAVDGVLPDPVSDGFGLATHLGDGVVLFGLVALCYWFGRTDDWQRRGLVVAVAVAALTLNAGLKGALDVQRPLYAARAAGEPLAFAPDAYDGYSTPSGHAMGAAAVYGALAALTDFGRRWQRYLVAGAVVAVVAFSRVVIGVHYLGDIVLGVALGVGLVWLGRRLATGGSRPVLAVFALALLGAAVATPFGAETHAAVSVGTSTGGVAGWLYVRNRRPEPSAGATVLCVAGVVGVALAVVALGAVLAVDTAAGPASGLPAGALRAVVSAAAAMFVLVLPVFAERLDGDPRVRWLQRTLPFAGGVDERAGNTD